MDKRVRVGFVGVGGIAKGLHLPGLAKVDGVEMVALCDASRERAEAACEEFGGRPYVDHHEMLEKEALDALYVCVPPDAHTDAELIAAEKGIHLFVEKPIVLTMEKGLQIWEAIERAGIISSVGYQLRYMGIAAARDFLKGKPVALVSGVRWGGIAGGPDHWWRVMERSGGQLHEMATHQIDFIRYLVGDISRVWARYSLNVLNDVENLTVPDAQAVVMEFKNGATGVFSTSCALTKGGGWSTMDVVLRDMMLRIAFDGITVSPEGAAEVPLRPAEMDIDAAFVHAVRTGDRSVIRSDYYDALKSTEVTLAANEAAETGKPVAMKLV